MAKAVCFAREHLHPGILPMLTALRERGYRLCILSNCSGEEVETVRGSLFAPFLDGIVLSHRTLQTGAGNLSAGGGHPLCRDRGMCIHRSRGMC